MVQGEGQDSAAGVIAEWNPVQYLREVDPQVVRYSRGFLRSRPERWFPGFAAQWLPLAHSLGVELKKLEVKPVIGVPRGHSYGYVASVDDEPLAVVFDEDAATVIANGLVPNSKAAARRIALEYSVRRFIRSLALSWSSGQASVIRYEPEMAADTVRETAGIKITGSINGTQVVLWVLLGRMLVEKFDGLWRRQLLANSPQREGSMRLAVELAHLTVPPTALGDYLRSGTDIDLEVPAGDEAVLLLNEEPAFQVRLYRSGTAFAFEVQPGSTVTQTLPEGTNRLSVQLCALSIESSLLVELGQPGAMMDSGVALTDQVALSVGGEQVGRARLRVYQGRLAITVL